MTKKHFFIIALSTIGIIGICTCDFRKDLKNQPRTNLEFSELPDTLKSLYLESTKYGIVINLDDTTKNANKEFPKLTNLNKNVRSSYSYIPSKICRAWYGEQVFTFNNKEVVLSWNGNEVNEPYILYNKELYFVISRNCYNKESFEKAEFGKYDLTKLIKEN